MYVSGGTRGLQRVHVANAGQLETNGSSFLAIVLALSLAVFNFKANLLVETKREAKLQMCLNAVILCNSPSHVAKL